MIAFQFCFLLSFLQVLDAIACPHGKFIHANGIQCVTACTSTQVKSTDGLSCLNECPQGQLSNSSGICESSQRYMGAEASVPALMAVIGTVNVPADYTLSFVANLKNYAAGNPFSLITGFHFPNVPFLSTTSFGGRMPAVWIHRQTIYAVFGSNSSLDFNYGAYSGNVADRIPYNSKTIVHVIAIGNNHEIRLNFSTVWSGTSTFPRPAGLARWNFGFTGTDGVSNMNGTISKMIMTAGNKSLDCAQYDWYRASDNLSCLEVCPFGQLPDEKGKCKSAQFYSQHIIIPNRESEIRKVEIPKDFTLSFVLKAINYGASNAYYFICGFTSSSPAWSISRFGGRMPAVWFFQRTIYVSFGTRIADANFNWDGYNTAIPVPLNTNTIVHIIAVGDKYEIRFNFTTVVWSSSRSIALYPRPSGLAKWIVGGPTPLSGSVSNMIMATGNTSLNCEAYGWESVTDETPDGARCCPAGFILNESGICEETSFYEADNSSPGIQVPSTIQNLGQFYVPSDYTLIMTLYPRSFDASSLSTIVTFSNQTLTTAAPGTQAGGRMPWVHFYQGKLRVSFGAGGGTNWNFLLLANTTLPLNAKTVVHVIAAGNSYEIRYNFTRVVALGTSNSFRPFGLANAYAGLTTSGLGVMNGSMSNMIMKVGKTIECTDYPNWYRSSTGECFYCAKTPNALDPSVCCCAI